MKDTLKLVTESPVKVHILENSSVNWNLLTLVVAILTLITAAILPFAQKKYEERKAKTSFRLYLKEQLGYLFSLITYDKIEYSKPTISDNFSKEPIILVEFAKRLKSDFSEQQNSLQPRVLFHFLNNLQKYCFHLYQIGLAISKIDMSRLRENILANGEKLEEEELKKTYGLLLAGDSFSSIYAYHDRFEQLNAVQRHIVDGKWVGMKIDNKLLDQQQLLVDDIKVVCDNEVSLGELFAVTAAIYNQVVKYYGEPGK
jgi:hypothetical protein